MVLPMLSASSCKPRRDGAGIGESQSEGEKKTLPVLLGHPQPPLSSGEKGGGPNAPIISTLMGRQSGEQPNYPDRGRDENWTLFLQAALANPSPAQEIN